MLYILAPFYIWQAVPIFIIIAGYNGYLFYFKRNISTLSQCYYLPIIAHRLNRILIPYFLIWTLQISVFVLVLNHNFSVPQLAVSFLTGGTGPGSYFVPIIIQHILITPVLYLMARRNASITVIVSFLLTISFEIFSVAYGISAVLYRLIYLRYLFAGALGVYIAATNNRGNSILILGSILSIIYIFLVNYLDFHLSFIHSSWISQNAPSFMWPMMMVMLGLDLLPQRVLNFPGVIISKIGEASYHIFLVQMTYYAFSQYVKLSISNLLTPLNDSMSSYMILQTSPKLLVAAWSLIEDLFICIILGYILYLIEIRIRKKYANIPGTKRQQKV